MPVEDNERIAMQVSAGSRLPLIAESFARIAGKPLVDPASGGIEEAMWLAPRVIMAQGIDAVPRIFYANRLALDLYEMTASAFIGMPSHLCAEPIRRAELLRMFARLDKDDWIEGFNGVRVASSGRRFKVDTALTWNVIDEHGTRVAQAASYAEWEYIDPA
ncbi:MEKHLA domain-containing protein [Altererythrobacter sp. Root672]|uniref:MEKHLA domain-containing protein n=1 Tax=Altererythrobacter sp. Root672 TaxID=1736584 RepID=UPI0006F3129E|nr:MEKHLA domain-containing protein [Altererythrobacter sp. Root672]KRA82940.1 hypothetical protein ASD76_02310 [Altererythrobacter sp. Root672]